MKLLFDEDYELLENSGFLYEEDYPNRFLILNNFPLQSGIYLFDGKPINEVGVLVIIPPNYNMNGINMFWTNPPLSRTDGKPIPAIMGFGGSDNRFYKGKEYCRWSRHWPANSWKPKVDTSEKIVSRIEWALRNPDAKAN